MIVDGVQRAVDENAAARRVLGALDGVDGGEVFVVGGAIRDLISGREPKDVDMLVRGVPAERLERTMRRLADADRGGYKETGKRFGVYRLKVHGDEVEVALPRKDTYERARRASGKIEVDHRMPVETDLLRRDFTVNAMAARVGTQQLIDPTGGLGDLAAGALRTTHERAFEEDPTRLIRALTMRGRFGLKPSGETWAEMGYAARLLDHESGDALNSVLDKTLASRDPGAAMRLAYDTNVLYYLFPATYVHWQFDQHNPHHDLRLGDHVVAVLETMTELTGGQVSEDDHHAIDLRLAALLHDVGKPTSWWADADGVYHFYENEDGEGRDHWTVGAELARTYLGGRLNYSAERVGHVCAIIREHMFSDFTTAPGARRFMARVGDLTDDMMLMRLADSMRKQSGAEVVGRMRELIERAREQDAPTKRSELAINGHDLVAAGLVGRNIGEVLDRCVELVVEDPGLNTRDALMEFVEDWRADGISTGCLDPPGR